MKFLVQALNKLIYTHLVKELDFLNSKDIVSIKYCIIRYSRKNGKNSYVDVRIDSYNKEGELDKGGLWTLRNTERIHKAFENIFPRQFRYSTLEYYVYCDAQKNADTLYRVIQLNNSLNSLGSGKTVNSYYLKTAL